MTHSDGVSFDIDIGRLPDRYDKNAGFRFFRATGPAAKRRVIPYDRDYNRYPVRDWEQSNILSNLRVWS